MQQPNAACTRGQVFSWFFLHQLRTIRTLLVLVVFFMSQLACLLLSTIYTTNLNPNVITHCDLHCDVCCCVACSLYNLSHIHKFWMQLPWICHIYKLLWIIWSKQWRGGPQRDEVWEGGVIIWMREFVWHIKIINYSRESLAVSGIHYGNYGRQLQLLV